MSDNIILEKSMAFVDTKQPFRDSSKKTQTNDVQKFVGIEFCGKIIPVQNMTSSSIEIPGNNTEEIFQNLLLLQARLKK